MDRRAFLLSLPLYPLLTRLLFGPCKPPWEGSDFDPGQYDWVIERPIRRPHYKLISMTEAIGEKPIVRMAAVDHKNLQPGDYCTVDYGYFPRMEGRKKFWCERWVRQVTIPGHYKHCTFSLPEDFETILV